MFQSSPARGGGCNGVLFGGTPRFKSVSILTRSWGRVQPKQVLTTVIEATFQSSPARGGGCNNGRAQRDALDLLVSILTRPWGRVQRHRADIPFDLVNGFNPHPPVVAGAT